MWLLTLLNGEKCWINKKVAAKILETFLYVAVLSSCLLNPQLAS
jgi:hypothetical protein